jgi:dTDP-4-dehydrorhamnose reductase
MKVTVLGGSGMLGSMLVDYLDGAGFEVMATSRPSRLERMRVAYPNCVWRPFDVGRPMLGLGRPDWIVNAIGLIKPHCIEEGGQRNAIRVNALFPWDLAEVAAAAGARVLQIGTDCVYAGRTGDYDEAAPHDAEDVYGQSKSLGEAEHRAVTNIRCSIVGPEPSAWSLLEWFLRQPAGATVRGYSDHPWNGVTTLHFAKVCAGIILNGAKYELPARFHLIPADTVSKADLLEVFAKAFKRLDVTIERVESQTAVNRVLTTTMPEVSRKCWLLAGYPHPPTIRSMIEELGAYPYAARGILL